MSEWSSMEQDWLQAPPPLPYDPYHCGEYDPYYREKQPEQTPMQQAQPQAQTFMPSPSTLTLLLSSQQHMPPPMIPLPPPPAYLPAVPKVDNPREMRNKAEKQRRDKLNQSIAELAALVPPVVYSSRKIDKTGVLRYTAHYLRSHQYVFDPSKRSTKFTPSSTQALLGLLNGFLLTTTYKGLIVVVSQNVNEYLGYTELELLGRSIFGIVHEEDRQLLREQLMPKSPTLGQNGEVVVSDEEGGRQKVAQALANEKRRFVVRFMKLSQRSEPSKYVTCHVEGSLRMSDRACRGYNRCCQMVRRARARGDNPCSSGNDVVFIGVVRPATETFINESALESYKMEYRTRHSIDGEIIQCEQRIALVTGYMTNEVNGVNAMNFIHRDEVRWVIIALREMYKQNQLFGESCYRLMTKDGQFIYMRTRGRLDVDTASRAVTSFVCTNTVVEEEEGIHLIKQMKDRYTMQVNNKDTQAIEDVKDRNSSQTVPVEDPRQLEKVILNLVTNLPPPSEANTLRHASPIRGVSSPQRLSIIAPKKERIVSAIEKIYSVIKSIPKQPSVLQKEYLPNERQSKPISINVDASDGDFSDAAISDAAASELEFSDAGPDADAVPNDADSDLDGSKYETGMKDASEIGLNTETPPDQDDSPGLDPTRFGVYVPTFAQMCYFRSDSNYIRQPFEWANSINFGTNIEIPALGVAGVKRHRFDEKETTNKKKVNDEMVDGDQIVAAEPTGRQSPDIGAFFDNAFNNPLVARAMHTLEVADHATLPELLPSTEVEEFFGQIHNDETQQ